MSITSVNWISSAVSWAGEIDVGKSIGCWLTAPKGFKGINGKPEVEPLGALATINWSIPTAESLLSTIFSLLGVLSGHDRSCSRESKPKPSPTNRPKPAWTNTSSSENPDTPSDKRGRCSWTGSPKLSCNKFASNGWALLIPASCKQRISQPGHSS